MNVNETRTFHLGDILSITTGILVSHDHSGGVYKLLDWMTGQTLMPGDLERAYSIALPLLKATFPQLDEIVSPTYLRGKKELQFVWLDVQAERYGQWFDVPRLPENAFTESERNDG